MSSRTTLPPLPPRAERRRAADRAWQAYIRDGAEAPGLPQEILRSWRRARAFRVDPAKGRSDRFLDPDALEERCSRDEVFRLAMPVLADFSRRLGLSEAALAYLDAEGWMLRIGGDPHIVEQVQEIAFRPGASWSEEVVGTNGPGTALAERKPVEIFASQHFVSACHPWTCAAAPIFAPGDPRPLGVVDITAPWELQRRHAILIASALAQAIQERLRASFVMRDEVVRHALRSARESGDALIAVDLRGRVIGVSDAAARRHLAYGGVLPPAAREAIVAGLTALSSEEGPARIETPDGALTAVPVRYDGAAVGAILRAPRPAAPRPLPVRPRPEARYDFCRIQGEAESLRRAVELARSAARHELPVVITGESGTGKELFAHAIHCASARQGGPFVAVNCGSIPGSLVESELFGYEPGAFTGGRRDGSAGRFEDAAGGTIFLDEITELPLRAQVALLRVLQEREVVRLGASAARPLDVRVLAACNRSLVGEVQAGRFRRDLFYRLAVIAIEVPPLRDRGGDVALLARAFLADAAAELGRPETTFEPSALEALTAYDWPGNVRELRNVVLRAAATMPGTRIDAAALALEPLGSSGSGGSGAAAGDGAGLAGADGTLRGAVHAAERATLLSALDAAGWNVVRTAERLGVSRMTLYRRMQRHGLSRGSPAS